MKENYLKEVVFILDRSGSMAGLEDDTIGGFNSILKKQREEDGDANVTTILFDQEIEMLHKRINIKDIKNITGERPLSHFDTVCLTTFSFISM